MKNRIRRIVSIMLMIVMISGLCISAQAVVSDYDQKYLTESQREIINQTTQDWWTAYAIGDTAGMAAAHANAEAERATASYSGGTDGSEYIPIDSDSSGGSGGGYYYTPTYYTITSSAGTGGSISPSGSASVTSGSSKSYTITANTGYIISNVIVDGVSKGAISSYSFSNVTSAHSISVTFASNATMSAGTATLGDGGSSTMSGGITKAGYGVTVNLSVASQYVSGMTVTATYNFGSGSKTVSLQNVGGTWQFPVNFASSTNARKIYIPVDTADGTYTITFTIKALDPQAAALTGSNVYLTQTRTATVTVSGVMYDDDFTSDW